MEEACKLFYGPFMDEINLAKLNTLCRNRFKKTWSALIVDGTPQLGLLEMLNARINVWALTQKPGQLVIFGPSVKYFSCTVGFAVNLSWNHLNIEAMDLPVRMCKGGDLTMIGHRPSSLKTVYLPDRFQSKWRSIVDLNIKALNDSFFRLLPERVPPSLKGLIVMCDIYIYLYHLYKITHTPVFV